MEIKRIYNNNVVVAVNGADGPEMIAIGKGLAFQKKPGDSIEQEKVEKIFTLEDSGVMTRLEKLVKDIPSVYLSISEEVVEMIRRDSDLRISEDLYITLTDHISMSLEREKNHVICENPLLLEIRQFYKEEFMLARKAWSAWVPMPPGRPERLSGKRWGFGSRRRRWALLPFTSSTPPWIRGPAARFRVSKWCAISFKSYRNTLM